MQTVKAEAAAAGMLSRRPEWEVEVAEERLDLAALPEEARRLIPGELVQQLRPAFSTEFTRTTWLLRHGESLVEVALDRGRIRAGDRSCSLSEVEIELKEGRADDLFDLAEAWLGQLPFRLEPRSKAQRGYQLAGAFEAAPRKVSPPALQPADPADRAWRAMLGAALGQFAANCPGFEAGGDPEYLHQMRVALRRLRTATSLARSLGMKRLAWDRDLRWLLDELSALRDWDVLATQALPLVSKTTGPRPIAALRRPLERARRLALERARSAVRAQRTIRMVLAIERALLEEGKDRLSAAAWAARALKRRWKDLRRAGKGFARLDDRGRHRLRIAGKKMRYAADAFSSLYGADMKHLLGLLEDLQDGLGAANDAVVAGRLLAGLAKQDTRLARPAALVGCVLSVEATARSAGLARVWRKIAALDPFRGQGNKTGVD